MFESNNKDKYYLKKINITSGLRSLSQMFFKCSMSSIDLSSWDTSNITAASNMFTMSKLTDVGDLSNWDTSDFTDMRKMFNSSMLTNAGDLSAWDTSNVTTMSSMFNNSELISARGLSNWNTRSLI